MGHLQLGRRTRAGLSALGIGIVVLVLDFVVKLGWTGFFVALVLLAVSLWVLVRGSDSSGPRTTFAYCVALAVLFLGFGWLHPQRWSEPGWKLARPEAILLARQGARVLFFDGGIVSARDLTTGQVIWRQHLATSKAVLGLSRILVQSPTDPARAEVVSTSSGQITGTAAWPVDPGPVIDPQNPTRPYLPVTRPTTKQAALMPRLRAGERVIAQARWRSVAARLDDAVDPTGHHYVRVDIVDGKTSETYRARGATGLQLTDAVLVINGPHPHVLALLRHTPKA